MYFRMLFLALFPIITFSNHILGEIFVPNGIRDNVLSFNSNLAIARAFLDQAKPRQALSALTTVENSINNLEKFEDEAVISNPVRFFLYQKNFLTTSPNFFSHDKMPFTKQFYKRTIDDKRKIIKPLKDEAQSARLDDIRTLRPVQRLLTLLKQLADFESFKKGNQETITSLDLPSFKAIDKATREKYENEIAKMSNYQKVLVLGQDIDNEVETIQANLEKGLREDDTRVMILINENIQKINDTPMTPDQLDVINKAVLWKKLLPYVKN